MALQKEIIAHGGFATNYHKIADVSLCEDRLSCTVNSYVSREYRELERPVVRKFFDFEITVEEEESMGIRKLAYKKIKELESWADAIDC